MFRRTNEDTNQDDTSTNQGSLLEGGAKDTVNLLSPSQAAAFQSQQPNTPPAQAQPIASSFNPATPPAPRPTPMPSPSSFRPASLSEPKRPEAPKPATAPASSSNFLPPSLAGLASKDAKRILTVGPEILMKGEINSCDRLVIEGKVDATVNDVHIMELAESGSFKGIATVEYAEISGLFEGDLVVKSRLIIYASGKVRGKVTYGEIEIERGGELTGEIKTIASAGPASARSNRVKEKEAA